VAFSIRNLDFIPLDKWVSHTRALYIIAEGSVVELSDLNDDAELDDCGVDSLLSLIITSRFRNQLDIDVKSETLFLAHPSR
jgi:acyl carrier protein